jgi:hypothetical protein
LDSAARNGYINLPESCDAPVSTDVALPIHAKAVLVLVLVVVVVAIVVVVVVVVVEIAAAAILTAGKHVVCKDKEKFGRKTTPSRDEHTKKWNNAKNRKRRK